MTSGSLIAEIITRTRTYADDPDVDAKYTDDHLLRRAVMPSFVDVLARLNLNRENPVVNKLAYTLDPDISDYALPPCFQALLRVAVENDDGVVLSEIKPRGLFDWRGPGVSLEANILRVDPAVLMGAGAEPLSVNLWYVNNGDILPHYSSAGGDLALNADDRHEFTLGTAATGEVDRRVNAYAGCTLRLLPGAPDALEERVIESTRLEGGEWIATLRHNFDETAVDTDIPYEIVPSGVSSIMEAVAVGAAMKVATWRRAPQVFLQALQLQYRNSFKTIADNVMLMNERTFRKTTKATIDRGFGPLGD